MPKINHYCPNCKIELIHREVDPPEILHCPVCPYNFAPNTKKMDSLYAALSVDSEGMEGIVATLQTDMPMPMVSSNKEIVEKMMTPEFRDSLLSDGMTLILAEFTRVKK
jgi:hypothetical protein